ncbi:hypothetical protein PRIPAC_86389, partial [Pristionchus pacificus]|uniref:Uncharacterized protein n=1 Tax=Pristionchus pacificus TaxID=54126 RepID=A0A2A6BMA2_PRIPA
MSYSVAMSGGLSSWSRVSVFGLPLNGVRRSGMALQQHVHHADQIVVSSELLPLVRVDRTVPVIEAPPLVSERNPPYHNLPADAEIDEIDPLRLLLSHRVVGRLNVAVHESGKLAQRVRRLDADHDQRVERKLLQWKRG